MRRSGSGIPWLLAVALLAGCTSPAERRERRLEAAQSAIRRGDLGRAEEILRHARGYDPRDPLIALRLARIQEDRGSFGSALSLLESFPDEIDSPDWLNLRARLLLHCGRLREAARIARALGDGSSLEVATEEIFRQRIVDRRLTPEMTGPLPDWWFSDLVDRFLIRRDVATALPWMELAVERKGGVRPSLEIFLESALESDSGDFVRRVDRLAGPAESAIGTLVHRRALVLAGKEAAVARLDNRFLTRYPGDPRRGEILVAEARRHLVRGEVEVSLGLAEEALTLDWTDVEALIVRGLALEWTGRAQEAEKAYRSVLAVDPDHRLARESLRAMREEPGAVVMRIESLQP